MARPRSTLFGGNVGSRNALNKSLQSPPQVTADAPRRPPKVVASVAVYPASRLSRFRARPVPDGAPVAVRTVLAVSVVCDEDAGTPTPERTRRPSGPLLAPADSMPATLPVDLHQQRLMRMLTIGHPRSITAPAPRSGLSHSVPCPSNVGGFPSVPRRRPCGLQTWRAL